MRGAAVRRTSPSASRWAVFATRAEKDLDTGPRLIHHLRYRGATCPQELPGLRDPLSADGVATRRAQDALDIAELKKQGFHATKARAPVRQVFRRPRAKAKAAARPQPPMHQPPRPH